MPRYIKVDALREKMFHKAFEEDSPDQKWDSGCWIRYHMFEDTIESIPTADVRENVHAHFIGTEYDGYADGYPVFYEWVCSNCGCIFEDEEPTYNFCPNCGAQMDERAKND